MSPRVARQPGQHDETVSKTNYLELYLTAGAAEKAEAAPPVLVSPLLRAKGLGNRAEP